MKERKARFAGDEDACKEGVADFQTMDDNNRMILAIVMLHIAYYFRNPAAHKGILTME